MILPIRIALFAPNLFFTVTLLVFADLKRHSFVSVSLVAIILLGSEIIVIVAEAYVAKRRAP